jgi:translation elongation factor EF-Ts
MSQEFVKDPSMSVEALVAATGKALGDTITVKAFERFQLGA